ncbi:DUF6894 family protein [Methylobacterium dankookense]|uniref:DUF6894 family protein n=1 Tax=Methylobacterium dankookense TaxID=560405 RepID=UPI0011A04170|nr:hypothetical protein [Methylobacterium dankookense]
MRFFFDVHSDSLSSWDDEGLECEGAAELLRHALKLLAELPERDSAMIGASVVSVRDESGRAVLTATSKPRSEPSLKWAQSKSSLTATA